MHKLHLLKVSIMLELIIMEKQWKFEKLRTIELSRTIEQTECKNHNPNEILNN